MIPNVLGIALWSPPLDQSGNSVRGIEFCKVSLKCGQFIGLKNLKNRNFELKKIKFFFWH